MLKKLFITLLFLTFNIALLKSQDDWQSLYEAMLEEYDEEINPNWQESLFEDLSYLHEHPLNINIATSEELKQIPFLTDIHIQSIHRYIQQNGGMMSTGELLLIDSLDYHTRNLLRHFVYAGAIEKKSNYDKLSWKNILHHSRHEVITRLNIPLYQKAGYKHYSDSILSKYPNRQYLGEPFYHNLRYRMRFSDKLSIGFCVEKDAGEPLFKGGFNGYDYSSLHLMISNIGVLKNLIIGDYRLRFGQGLVMNTDFNLGKIAMLNSMGWTRQSIKPHIGTTEQQAFRGVAATIKLWKGIEATAFGSFNRIDANINKDLLITSLKTDGLHRTPLEYSKRYNTHNTLYGSNLSINHKGFHGGLTAVYNVFNRVLKPSEQLYKLYYPRGKEFFTIGSDYTYLHHQISIAGETAFSQGGGIATLNRLQLRIGQDNTLTLVQRYYSHHYIALYGNSFSENSTLQNESGIYMGIDMHPWRKWTLSAYGDFCYFPWLKYQVSSPSYGGEGMIRLTYSHNEKTKTSFRYRIKLKEKDYKNNNQKEVNQLLRTHHRVRLQQDYSPTPTLQLNILADYNLLQFANEIHQGFMLTQRFTWKTDELPITLFGTLSYFHTDNYDTRISIYERTLLHTFSFPSYYGHGLHLSTTCQWEIHPRLTLFTHLNHTHYYNRQNIGSGTELINQSHREDIGIQLKWKM